MRKKNKKIFIIDKVNFLLINTFFINKLIIFELDIENPKKIIPSPINLSFRICKKKDIDLMDNEFYDYNEKGKKYSKNQFDKGDRCILAINNDRIIGYVWIMKNHMELSVYNHIPISTKRSYIYKGFVLKEFRGKRVLNAIDKYIIDLLNEDGKKFIVTTVSIYNKHSIRARERLGFKRVGKIIQMRFLGLKYDYIPKKELKYLQSP
jgi:L-amino acid N-acyltransferase YncA